MPMIPNSTLADGVEIPQLMFGTYLIPPDQTEAAVLEAFEAGYRGIDTASVYGNEAGVGRAIRASGLKREEVFVTTKLWNTDHGANAAKAALDASLDRLGLDYVDLYLIHWPVPTMGAYVETWAALCDLSHQSRFRSLGVSNFLPGHLDKVVAATGVTPSLNQIELHPRLPQRELAAYCAQIGVAAQAWSPLGQGHVVSDPAVTGLAAKYGRTPAQVVLRWHLDSGHLLACKTVSQERMVENMNIFDFSLEPDDALTLGSLPPRRYGPRPETFVRD
ncbi:MAG: aldo/keto reductase [Candidatus Limnocylindrales bacterium]